MSDDPATESGPPAAMGKALSVRAVVTGLVLVLAVAAITPVNDWLLHNTYFYSQHLPVGVFLLVILASLIVNPLLGRFRYRAGEMMVIVAMLLVLGGVASSGLNRVFPAVIAGPAKILPTSTTLAPFVADDGTVHLPEGPYIGLPGNRLPDTNDPEYRYAIEGYHQGFGSATPSVRHRSLVTWQGPDGQIHRRMAMENSSDDAQILDLRTPLGRALIGQRVEADVDGEGRPIHRRIAGPDGDLTLLAVEAPAIPWGMWMKALLAWTPLLLSAMVCFLAIAALVRRQWMNNERLTYPIANVLVGFLRDPEPGFRLAPLFHSRVFWCAFAIVVTVLFSQALATLGVLPFGVPTKISLQAFNSQPFNMGYAPSAYLTLVMYFSIIGIAFFLPADISFSVWFCFIIGNIIYAVVAMSGVPLDRSIPARVTMGGWFIQCVLILWIGRRYYAGLLKAAFSSRASPETAELRPFTWAFLLGAVGMVLAMVALGAELGAAIVAALCYLGLGLVMARLIAEAGIPFIQTPLGWNVNQLIYSLVGFNVPMAALIPLTMLGQTLCSDPREHLLPFATNAEYLAARAGASRVPWAAFALLVLGIGTIVAGASMLWCAYEHEGHQALDSWWGANGGPFMSSLEPVAAHAQGSSAVSGTSTYVCYGVGAATTAGLGVARLAWAWWPVHPIGVLICATYPTFQIWFSFLLGWLIKVLVMRYGGMQLYQRLKPAAMGLIAAEAVIAGIFLVVGIIAGVYGTTLPALRFLPG